MCVLSERAQESRANQEINAYVCVSTMSTLPSIKAGTDTLCNKHIFQQTLAANSYRTKAFAFQIGKAILRMPQPVSERSLRGHARV